MGDELLAFVADPNKYTLDDPGCQRQSSGSRRVGLGQ